MTDLENYLKKKYGAVKEISELKPKKKVKKKRKELAGVKIVDEDAVWQKNIDENVDDGEEDAPAVVEDEELTKAKRKELLRQRTILAIGEEGGGWVDVTPAERKSGSTSATRVRHDTPERQERDMSPPRKGASPDMSPPRAHTRQGSPDISPPRRSRHDSPDMSPPRRRHGSEEPEGLSPKKKDSEEHSPRKEDLSPPRGRPRHDSPDISPPRHREAEDLSPPQRRIRHDSPDNSLPEEREDLSPPRRGARHDSADMSPPRRPAKPVAEDLSPPRRRARHDSPDNSPPRHPAKHDMEDLSPPRRARHDSPDASPPRRPVKRDTEDLSPPRRSARHDSPFSPRRAKRAREEGDLSPPTRKARHVSPPRQEPEDLSPPRKRANSPSKDLSPPRRRASSPQPASRRGGLKTGREIQQEIEEKQKQEAKRLRELDPEISGRGAETVYRDKYGRKLSGLEELMKQQQGPAKPTEKPLEWGTGLAQKREVLKRQKELEAEKAKPFARTKDDLDEVFKNRIRWGDPMAHLVKQSDEQLLEDFSKNEKMQDSGFNVPQDIPAHSWLKRRLPAVPNRYNIRPGRHWDGIDRSNGFEEKLFKAQNEKKAQQDMAYKWSVEDM